MVPRPRKQARPVAGQSDPPHASRIRCRRHHFSTLYICGINFYKRGDSCRQARSNTSGCRHHAIPTGSKARWSVPDLVCRSSGTLEGCQYLLQAFSQLKTTNAELWLAGRVLPEIEGTLARFGGDRVRVLGQVPNADMPGIYQQADVLVFPTLLDGFSLAIAEAMACGIPVIATEHSSGPDVIDDGTDGFVIPVRDVDAIVDKVTWLDQHRGHAREMGVAARQKIARDFGLDRYAEAHRQHV